MTPDASVEGRDASMTECASDEACDDGLFCNGAERCAPGTEGADARGCTQGSDPCLAGQRCDESVDECRTTCSVSADADGDGVDAVACGGADCDDTNPNRFPGNVEICDAANVDEDCDPTTFGARDRDGDGYVDAACCNVGSDGARFCGDDCSDARRDMRPGFAETCDYLDNDCDGMTDEGASVMGFADEDRDRHGDPMAPMVACPDTLGFSVVDDDCNDMDPEVHGAQLEICDRKDNDCDGMIDEAPAAVSWYVDADDDGFGTASGMTRISCDPIPGYSLRSSDCNDMDRNIGPAAREACNGIDDDCNGRADAMIRPGDFEDDDGDGFADEACGGNDCDDSNASVHPGAPELCDGIDNDCDGIADGATAMALWYFDFDHDGYGDESMPPIEDCDPQPGRVPRGGDCNDASGAIHPGVADICDGVDQDCDGAIDESAVRLAYYSDGDGDGYGDSASAVTFLCRPAMGRATRVGDCDDRAADRYPGAPELCDLFDNDCDMRVDEDAPTMWYPDVDRDGHGVMAGAIETCAPPPGYAMLSDDCDDASAARFPGNPERCDLIDNDCDGTSDEGGAAACAVAGGTGACTAGVCSVASCMAGRADCDTRFETGCEVATATNARHCGGCGMACATGDTCGLSTLGMCDGSGIAEVIIGESTSFARRSTGGVLAWGSNGSDHAGSGGPTAVPAPVPIFEGALAIRSGENHACVVTAARTLFCWGDNGSGQLGDGTTTRRATPVPATTLTDVRDVALGDLHSCALRMDGTVWCWGSQRYGQLGDGVIATTNRLTPIMVPGIGDAVEISSGYNHVCVRRPLAGGFRVQCWGSDFAGSLGRGTTGTNSATPGDVIGLPTDITGFANGVTGNHSCVILSSGTARCWGESGFGAVPSGRTDQSYAYPTPVAVTQSGGAEATGMIAMCSGVFLSCALRDSGTAGRYQVWCSGADDFGQLGDGMAARSDSGRLQRVVAPEGAAGFFDDAVALGCGRNHACAARADGSVWCWGNDQFENLGNGEGTTPRTNPAPLRVLGL